MSLERPRQFGTALAATLLMSFAPAATHGGEAPRIEDGAVSFYSSKGKAMARRLHIPPPPIEILPMRQVDAPRTVVARKWKSAFCSKWDDGCTRCEHDELAIPPVCNDVILGSESNDASACVSGSVKCRGERDILKYCASGGIDDQLLLSGKSFKNFDSGFDARWVYFWDKETHTGSWRTQLAEEQSLPTRSMNDPLSNPSQLSEEKNIYCNKAQTNAEINPQP
jgi:hypothetical protein